MSPDQHPSRVEAEHLSAAGEPLEPRVAVLDRHRVGELGCETEVNGGRDDVVRENPLDEHRCDGPSTAADHAATVDEIDPRTRRTVMVTAPQHRDDDLAAAVTGHGVIGYLDRPPRDDVVEDDDVRVVAARNSAMESGSSVVKNAGAASSAGSSSASNGGRARAVISILLSRSLPRDRCSIIVGRFTAGISAPSALAVPSCAAPPG